MIQRIQSLYLLFSAVLTTVCLMRPVGHFATADGFHRATLYNLWLSLDTGGHQLSPWALFALLVIAGALTLIVIFLFRFRALQMRLTSLSMLLIVGYYIVFAVFAHIFSGDGSFRPAISAALPFASLVFDYLAFRAIWHDEQLVRSLNRLR